MQNEVTFVETSINGANHLVDVSVALSFFVVIALMISALIRGRFFDIKEQSFLSVSYVALIAAGGYLIGYVSTLMYHSPAMANVLEVYKSIPVYVASAGLAALALWLLAPCSMHKELTDHKEKDLRATFGGEDDEALFGGALTTLFGAIAIGFLAYAPSAEVKAVSSLIVVGDDMRLGAFHAFVFTAVLSAVLWLLSSIVVTVLGRFFSAQKIAILFALLVLIYPVLIVFGII